MAGRPREFDRDQALRKAMLLFWQHGYEGTSMSALVEALGIASARIYAAFGNKEALFHKALDLYEAEKLAYTREALQQPTARAVAEHLMRGAIAAQSNDCGPGGCLRVITSSACGSEGESIKADVMKRRASSQAALVERFRTAQAEGDLPAHLEPEALTAYIYALVQGMAVQAGSGATRADLERVVDTSLAMWPTR